LEFGELTRNRIQAHFDSQWSTAGFFVCHHGTYLLTYSCNPAVASSGFFLSVRGSTACRRLLHAALKINFMHATSVLVLDMRSTTGIFLYPKSTAYKWEKLHTEFELFAAFRY